VRLEMKYMLPVPVAVLLTVCSVHSGSAQVLAFTNADVTRLVAMHVSDQTVIAVIHEAKATQFDLSPRAVSELGVLGVSTAVIASMRQPSTASGPVVAEQSPVAGVQTLAGAAAIAKAQAEANPSAWRPSSTSGPSSRTALPALTSTSEGTTITATTVGKDEAYWRGRLKPLQTKLGSDIETRRPVASRLVELSSELEPNLPSFALFGAEIGRLTTEVQRLNLIIANDNQDIDNLREEGRHAGALPGWLR
jgi:hypothetical protein